MRSPTIWPSPRRTPGAHAEGGARARASCFGSRTCRGWAEAIRMPRHAPAGHFKTSRLTFSPIALDDASRIFDGYASREISTRFMNFARHESLAESEAWAARCVDCWNDGSAFPWTLKQRHTGAYIGNLELRVAPPKADFGYAICEDAWGQGYATEAASAVVRWALQQPEIFRVWATCHPENAASARVLEKSGLRFEACLANWEARPQLGELAGDSLAYVVTKPAT